MEKKLLLIITKNTEFANSVENKSIREFSISTINSIHAAYNAAVNILPDVILIDFVSLGLESLKNLQKFKATHFLNKTFLFLLGDEENRKILNNNFQDAVDGIIYGKGTYCSILNEIQDRIKIKRCLSNYWKDSFMGLFNLLNHPVILLQDEKIVAMNDSFKNDFFITTKQEVLLSDLVVEKNKLKVKETLKRFLKGKHMKATTKTMLLMKDKKREAKITFSKLDKSICGQLIMMINFTGKISPLNENVGTHSKATENYFSCDHISEEQAFTKREKEIISLLCKGYKTREISENLCISEKTIEKHRANIVKRTHSGTIIESIVYALNHKMIELQ